MAKFLATQRASGLRALDASGDGYWELNLLDGSAWFSDWFLAQLEWSGDSRQNSWSALRDYLMPSSWAHLLQSMRTHLEERVPLDLDVSVRATTNQRPADQSTETRCWRIRGAAERNSLGQPRYLSGVAQDVTSERAARLALLGELGELRELRESFEALPTAVALINESGVIQRSNRRWQAAAAALALDDGLLDVGRDYLADWQQLAPAPETRVVERLRALLGGAEFEFTDVVTVSLAHAPLRIGIAARRFVIDGKTQLAVIHDYLP